MVICPHCKTKFPAGRVLIEEFQTTKMPIILYEKSINQR